MRVAVVHDWLTVYAGAERVLERILRLFPGADLFVTCDFVPRSERDFLRGVVPRTSFIQSIPLARTRYRAFLPLMPLAVEQHDLRGYDVVISSSHAVAKGVITSPDQFHLSYVHSPMRYAWDLQAQYLSESGLSGLKLRLAQWQLHKLRLWDLASANRVDSFVANSCFIRDRIRKIYRRFADVVYPPVAVSAFSVDSNRGDYYVTASRMVPYKRVDLVVEAFGQMPEKKLIVVGDGPEMPKIRGLAKTNVQILGHVSSGELAKCVGGARAFVFAGEEDFGIAPVEAQACGVPVIAFGKGGALETVRDGITGVFFREQTCSGVVEAVSRFESMGVLEPRTIRGHAVEFSEENFDRNFLRVFQRRLAQFQERRRVNFLARRC